jgi:hypothetical protein
MTSAETGRGRASPLEFLSGRERRKWRLAERRALRDHDAQQLTTLRSLAATGGGLTGLLYQDSRGPTAAAEFIIAGQRIRAGRVHQPALRALTQAIAGMSAVRLLAASRYGPYWVLTFELPTVPLAVLADKLIILSARDDGSTWPVTLTPPAGRRRQPAGLIRRLHRDVGHIDARTHHDPAMVANRHVTFAEGRRTFLTTAQQRARAARLGD